jgi:hypothetical protein
MSDDANKPPYEGGPTEQFERPDFEELDDADGTQELDASKIEAIEHIEDSAIEPIEPPQESLQRDSSSAESTQVIERDRLERAAELDQPQSHAQNLRQTDQMSAVDRSTAVHDEPREDIEERTTSYKIPEELLEEASGGSSTQKMSAIDDETVEFDGLSDQWVEVDDNGVLQCLAHVDSEGRLVIPQSLLRDGVVRPGMKVVIEAQLVRTDD